MSNRPYDLPSLSALVCFEAAARHESFKRAAAELNVTPAAVSHQVKGLEAELGRPLFRRQHRGVELTESGAYLLLAAQRGFETLSDAIAQLRGPRRGADVAVAASTAISALWLTPRLAAFWKARPGISVSQIVSDPPDRRSRWDLLLEYGDPEDRGGEARVLFADRIMALGTRRFAAEHGIETLDDLWRAPLIHLETGEGQTGWNDWRRALGLGPATLRGFAVNNYIIALQAAQDDMGAVLGWNGLTAPMVEAGALTRLTPEETPSPRQFILRIHPEASENARVLADWLSPPQP